MDPAWRSTDQEVGCSSRPGRADEILVVAGDFTCPVLVEGFEQGDLREPFARSDLVGRSPWQLTRTICAVLVRCQMWVVSLQNR